MRDPDPVPPPGTPASFDVPGVGRFVYSGFAYELRGDERSRLFVARIGMGGREPAKVFAYLQDGHALPTPSYAEHIRRTVAVVTPDCRALLRAAQPRLLQLMADYGLAASGDYDTLVDELLLEDIKPFPHGGAELVFGTCSRFRSLDVNVRLDAELQFEDIWFDG
jgi:hypothetical protein